MSAPLLPLVQLEATDGPRIYAVELTGDDARVTTAHRHARGQLFGAISGLLSVGTEHSQWVVPATHAVWIPPELAHSVQSHGPFSGWSVYVAAAACRALPDEPCTLPMSLLLRAAISRAATWNDDPLDDAQTRIAGVIIDEIRSLPREQFGLPMPRDARLIRIANALAKNLADNRRLEEWAQWAAIAPRTLSRRFITETGFSFAEWRQRARLMRALEMLAAGDAVTRVAIDLGYDNVSAFIAMFRRALGVTPARYFAAQTSGDEPDAMTEATRKNNHDAQ
ncbi:MULTISPECIES: helix-turn-helix domain-containing protein [Paraburkholderia]|uniref:AraC family transcriptional regulator n=1 Tax=Paraburkholderia TaxID=1822464 RepID=UPI00224D14FE|nr:MULTISPECIES: helix-turn-helix transcriptional regulator [Paraburkholderia]MCX4163128.1 helix-turn-helix transcriptional regulator [Paraburkholderia megapolitana]MDN7158624.1 helix-turn-helix transcriptional regulator [Paraburkholderia sp. CHISQ3]MDQ6495671.1 helix-turn-helix transcriptional regulator [Paraburkholderia megapolitana]